MAQIKIIAAPPGQAPDWAREAQVGLILSVAENIPPNSFFASTSVTGILDDRIDKEADSIFYGYSVNKSDFLKALEAKNPAASRWFKENIFLPKEVRWLVFRKDVCQLL
jgi:hypothetical protein